MNIPTYTPVWNWRNRVNAKKRYKVHICIYLNQEREYYTVPTPLNVAKTEWDNKPNSWIKNTHPYAFEINQTIKEKLDLLTDLNKRYFLAKKSLTFPLIFKELQKSNNTNSFNFYFEEIIKDPPETLDDETMKRYHATLFNLNKFNPAITFNDLSEDLFLKFKKHCLEKANLVGSTTNGYFNACKKVVNWARKDNHITKEHEESIFEDIHITIGKPKKDRLEIEEITAWKNYQFTDKQATQDRDRNLFLFQIYTGFYINDVNELLKAEFKRTRNSVTIFRAGDTKMTTWPLSPYGNLKMP
jgi:hypothetical protein